MQVRHIALLLLAAATVEGGRPRPRSGEPHVAAIPSSAVETGASVSDAAATLTLSSQVATHMSGLRESMEKYMKVWGPNHERILDHFSAAMLEIKRKRGEDAGSEQSEGSENQKEAPPSSFTKYSHYEAAGYEPTTEAGREKKNGKLLDTIPKKAEDENVQLADLSHCDAPQHHDPVVKDLQQCLNSAYTFFTDTVTKSWASSHKQNDRDSKVLNLMFDRVLDLSNMRRSLDAYQRDETAVSKHLLNHAKTLREKINTLIDRGEDDAPAASD